MIHIIIAVIYLSVYIASPNVPYEHPTDIQSDYNLAANIFTMTWTTHSNADVIFFSKMRTKLVNNELVDEWITVDYQKVTLDTKARKLVDIDPQYGDVYHVHEAWIDDTGTVYFDIEFIPEFQWSVQRYQLFLPLTIS